MNSQIDAHESCINGKLDFLSMPTVSEDELPDRLDEILSAIDNGSGPYLILCNNGSNLLLFGWEDYWHRFGVLYRDGEKEQIEAACIAAEKE